jgi:hypothetical protein
VSHAKKWKLSSMEIAGGVLVRERIPPHKFRQ